jgi:hypothetical protein
MCMRCRVQVRVQFRERRVWLFGLSMHLCLRWCVDRDVPVRSVMRLPVELRLP